MQIKILSVVEKTSKTGSTYFDCAGSSEEKEYKSIKVFNIDKPLKAGLIINAIKHDFSEQYNSLTLKEFEVIGEFRQGLHSIEAENIYRIFEDYLKQVKTRENFTIWGLIELVKCEFLVSPAATTHHHNYKGGLIQHTLEVFRNIEELPDTIKINKDVCLKAAILHDIAKMFEYKINENGTISYNQEFKERMNIQQEKVSAHILYARDMALRNGLSDEIIHCIESHHGHTEYGSIVSPKSAEAVTLHWADMMSCKTGAKTINELENIYGKNS